MKRVFAILCALALVLPMICTGAAAADPEEQQQEQYVFEKMPDIMLLDDFVFSVLEDSDVFVYMGCLPSGWYNLSFQDVSDGTFFDSVEPFKVSYGLLDFDDDGNLDEILGCATDIVGCVRGLDFSGNVGVCFAVSEYEQVTFFWFTDSVDWSLGDIAVFTSVEDPNAAPGGMPAVLGQMDTTVPSLLDTVYSMIRSNSLLAFLAFCGILAAAAALYSSLKAGAK